MDEPPQVQVDLPQDLTAAAAARSATRGTLRGWSLMSLIDPVLLTVSELVGNAVRHGRPPVGLALRRSGRGVRIDVHDEAQDEPALGQAAAEVAESGRGLQIVQALSSETGVEQLDGDGKVVWAQIDPEDPPPC